MTKLEWDEKMSVFDFLGVTERTEDKEKLRLNQERDAMQDISASISILAAQNPEVAR